MPADIKTHPANRHASLQGATFTKPWTLEYPFHATPGPVYEYACHEGNYAMPDILGGARKADAAGPNK